MEGKYWWNELGGSGFEIEGFLLFRTGERFEFSIDPGYERHFISRQYIDTFGRRYVFSWIERSTLSAEFRLGDAFTIENEDFNHLSFRSDMVLRREWRPGSTLFLVWQQNRILDEEQGGLVGGRDLRRSFSTPGDNFFALKISYWLGLD